MQVETNYTQRGHKLRFFLKRKTAIPSHRPPGQVCDRGYYINRLEDGKCKVESSDRKKLPTESGAFHLFLPLAFSLWLYLSTLITPPTAFIFKVQMLPISNSWNSLTDDGLYVFCPSGMLKVTLKVSVA